MPKQRQAPPYFSVKQKMVFCSFLLILGTLAVARYFGSFFLNPKPNIDLPQDPIAKLENAKSQNKEPSLDSALLMPVSVAPVVAPQRSPAQAPKVENIITTYEHKHVQGSSQTESHASDLVPVKLQASPVADVLIDVSKTAETDTIKNDFIVKQQSIQNKEGFVGYGIVSLSPEFDSTKIVGRDRTNGTQANLIATSNYGARVSYAQVWSEKFQTDLFFALSKLNIKEPSAGGFLQSANQSLCAFGAGAKYQLSSKLSLLTRLGFHQRVYLKAISSTTVELDPLSVPSLSIVGAYDFLNRNPFVVGAGIGTGVDLPASEDAYKTRMNPNFQAMLYIKHHVSQNLQTEVGLKSHYLIQNTSIAKQSQTDLGIYLRMSFNLEQEKRLK